MEYRRPDISAAILHLLFKTKGRCIYESNLLTLVYENLYMKVVKNVARQYLINEFKTWIHVQVNNMIHINAFSADYQQLIYDWKESY